MIKYKLSLSCAFLMIHLPAASLPPLSALHLVLFYPPTRRLFFSLFPHSCLLSPPFPLFPLHFLPSLSTSSPPPLPFSGDTKRGGKIRGCDCQINYSFCAITLTQRSFPVLRVVIKLTAIPAARRHQPNRIFMEAADGMADLH